MPQAEKGKTGKSERAKSEPTSSIAPTSYMSRETENRNASIRAGNARFISPLPYDASIVCAGKGLRNSRTPIDLYSRVGSTTAIIIGLVDAQEQQPSERWQIRAEAWSATQLFSNSSKRHPTRWQFILRAPRGWLAYLAPPQADCEWCIHSHCITRTRSEDL